ncbi:MAG: glycosyltransferase family 39 protein [Dehalococcoidia bacterium]
MRPSDGDEQTPHVAPQVGRSRVPFLSRRFIAVYIGLAVSALFLGAYWWSAGGAQTHVRIETRDGVYTVFVDGTQQVKAYCDRDTSGAVIVMMPVSDPAAALPHPRGLDRLRVTDADSGAVLLDLDSAALSRLPWTQRADGWLILNVGSAFWSNYIVDAYFANATQGSIFVHASDPSNGIAYSFRPYRHLDNGLDYVQAGKTQQCPVDQPSTIGPIGTVGARGLQMSKIQTLKSMVAMVVRPLPLIFAAALIMLMAVVVLQLLCVGRLLRPLGKLRFGAGNLVLVVAAAAFGVLLYISRGVNGGMPHVPDEVSYVFQAKLLATFHLTTPAPSPATAFSFFYPSLLVNSGGHWASIYPFGHPLVLAIGELVGAVWLIPPLLGALSILLIYRVGKRIHGAHVGAVAAVLLAFSPFFQMTASNLMSHNTAMFYLLVSLFFITAGWRRRSLAYGLGGVFFGLLLNTRPLTASALVLPFGLLFLSDLVLERGQRMAVIRRSFAFAGGVLLMVGATYLYNLGTTGSLSSGYGSGSSLETVIGFGNKNSLARGLENDQAQLSALLPSLNGWPLFVGLALVPLPFLLGSRSRWDVFLLLAAVCAMGVWTLYESSGLMHGPRYWFEAVPFLMLLSARGLTLLQERLAHWARLILGRLRPTEEPIVVARATGYAVLGVLLAVSVHGWMLGKHYDIMRNDFMPRTISELKGFNGADGRLLQAADDMNIHNALILVAPCNNWQCYGTVFWKNSPDFNGDIIWAKDVPEMRYAATLDKYAGRKIYLADYGADTIVPYEPPPLYNMPPG